MGSERFKGDLPSSSTVNKIFESLKKDCDSPKFFERRKLEAIPLSSEQETLIQSLNTAARSVLSSFAPGEYPDPKFTILYRVVPLPDPDDEQIGPHSVHDGLLDAISIRDVDVVDESGNIDNNLLVKVYAHELAHHHGVTHIDRRTSKKIVGRGFWPDSQQCNYRGLSWFDESATTYLAANILFAAGLRLSPEPQQEDWSDREDDFRICFEAMTTNIAKYLNYPENMELLTSLQARLALIGFVLTTPDETTIKRLLVIGRVNKEAHDELVSLLKTAYSQKPVGERRYRNVWDKLQDDIGLFGIFGTNLEDLEL